MKYFYIVSKYIHGPVLGFYLCVCLINTMIMMENVVYKHKSRFLNGLKPESIKAPTHIHQYKSGIITFRSRSRSCATAMIQFNEFYFQRSLRFNGPNSEPSNYN